VGESGFLLGDILDVEISPIAVDVPPEKFCGRLFRSHKRREFPASRY
jgi:hypothetical protein